MTKKICISITLASIFFIMGGCAKQEDLQNNSAQSIPDQPIELNSEKSCQNDADCSCGRHKDTKQCFFGNINYIDPAAKPCPDFCGGIDGKLTVKCVDNLCKQAR